MKLKKQYPREYRIWKALRARCSAPCYSHQSYQKKGVKCCRRWQSFEHFFSDMGPCPEGWSIDRIDNDGDYEPSNCRWADAYTQTNNRGAFTPKYEHGGEMHTLKEWSRILGINYLTLYMRMTRTGLSFEEAIVFIDPRDELLEWKGKKYTRQQLCDMYDIPLKNFYDRTHRGWSLERILTTPVHKI